VSAISFRDTNSADGALLSPEPTMIEVRSGRYVDVRNPDPATILPEDIAHHLSMLCRFAGGVSSFYSVAEHTVLVHDMLASKGHGQDIRLAALLHDGAEAYLADVPAPVKHAMRSAPYQAESAYDVLTERMDAAIAEAVGITPTLFRHPLVMEADLVALRVESRRLTASGGRHWRFPAHVRDDVPPGVLFYAGLAPDAARAMWLRRFRDARARHRFAEDAAPPA
jgi:hypothetical protein